MKSIIVGSLILLLSLIVTPIYGDDLQDGVDVCRQSKVVSLS